MFTLTDTAAQGTTLLDYPAPAGRVIRGAFDDALETNPIPLFMLSRELDQQKETGPRITAEDARARIKAAGVKITVPDESVSELALNTLIERQRDRAARDVLFARSPGGATTAGVFAAGMAGALMDPLNAASGFIPVMAGTRFATAAASGGSALSRAGARLGVGAIEGAVGAAAVEGPTLALRRELQDEYSLYDSLANMAFGTFASAGIRGVAGAARDAWVGVRNLRQAEQQSISTFMAETTPEARAAAVQRQAGGEMALLDAIPEAQRQADEAMAFVAAGNAADEVAEAAVQRARITAMADQAIERRISRFREEELARGIDPDEALLAALRRETQERALLSPRELAERTFREMDLAEVQERIASGRGMIIVPHGPSQVAAAISEETHAQALKIAVSQAIEGRRINTDPVVRTDPAFGPERISPAETLEAARSSMDVEQVVGADRRASQDADTAIKEAAAPEKQATQTAEVISLAKSKEVRDAKAKADEYAKAYESLAACAGGRGL